MTVTLVAMLWPNDGQEQALIDYEDTVLALIPVHGGRVISRVRKNDETEGPFEVQVIEMPNDEAITAYMTDPIRVALRDTQVSAIARTVVVRGDQVV